eukprot:SAG22_NODE_1664_length_3864_cov_1.637716_1_plen_60_part_00
MPLRSIFPSFSTQRRENGQPRSNLGISVRARARAARRGGRDNSNLARPDRSFTDMYPPF